jgi:quinolinate synthase
LEKILAIKAEHPEAKILVHPECPAPIQKVADVIGSTAGLLNFAIKDEATEFIVATESGILHEMKKACPDKLFIPAPQEMSEAAGCSCNECEFMKLNTLNKLYNTLKYEWPAIEVAPEIAEKAIKPIDKMLEISKNLKSAMSSK